jgi:hypothetical protein
MISDFKPSPEPDALERAVEFGVDLTLLEENLKLNPTERLRKAQRAIESLLAFENQARLFRERQTRV